MRPPRADINQAPTRRPEPAGTEPAAHAPTPPTPPKENNLGYDPISPNRQPTRRKAPPRPLAATQRPPYRAASRRKKGEEETEAAAEALTAP